jgi:hypothetical protein
MDYQFKKFTVPLTSDKYAEGWDRVFGKKPECEGCGGSNDVTFDSCPYASEINGDDTPYHLCAGCRYERAMDI